jgi:acyl-coenzyme A thioesterase PaaI-like protein
MGTRNYRMRTAESVLRRGLEGGDTDRTFTLDPAFQGLPDTAHGGSVLAAFRLLAGEGARQVRGHYVKRVPLGVPLSLKTTRGGAGLDCQLLDGANATLVHGHVTADGAGLASAAPEPPAVAPPLDPCPLPVSRTCFACGTENALGLGVRLALDARSVGGVWTPRETFRADDGTLAGVAVTTLLDEAAFWLGALASGESGMTTELAVTFHRPVAFGGPLSVAGARDRVRQRPDDPRYWNTEVAARDEHGRLVADGRITFVAVRGAARRLAAWLGAVNPREVVQRVFPAYVP